MSQIKLLKLVPTQKYITETKMVGYGYDLAKVKTKCDESVMVEMC